MLLNCGYSSSSAPGSYLPYRAFFSEQVSAGTIAAGVYIVDARHDLDPGGAPMLAGNTPGKMVLTPNRALTLVFSGYLGPGSDNVLTVIANSKETAAGNLALPGFTESIVSSPDSNSAYVAVPTAKVVGQSPGAIKAISLGAGAFTGEVDIPSVRYLAISNSGTRLLAFTDVPAALAGGCDPTPSSVFVIVPSDIGQPCPAKPIPSNLASPFDHPVTAFFSSDDSTAYVVNCGAECGGVIASVQPVDMNLSSAGTAVQVPAATTGLMQGSTLYLAGTPYSGGNASLPCPAGTLATSCGALTIFDLPTMSISNASMIPITDGYHTVMTLGGNGQLFIGARTCTEIALPNATNEVRGCLSIYNTQSVAVGTIPPNAVIVPPAGGDVTGIQPIAQRTVVYVVQNGTLNIYDTTTDALAPNPRFPNSPGKIVNLIGQFYDVKTIDF